MGISASDRQRRLLVLGAGPAQLGLLRAARERGLFIVACDRDAQAPGFEYADKRAIVSAEDEPAIGKLAEAEGIDGVIAPGIDWPVAIAARVARALRPSTSAFSRDRVARGLPSSASASA